MPASSGPGQFVKYPKKKKKKQASCHILQASVMINVKLYDSMIFFFKKYDL